MLATDYDGFGRVVMTTLPDPDGAGPLAAPTITYAYDNAGNLLSETNAANETTLYAYDRMNRETSVTNAGGEVTTYGYDKNSSRTSLIDPEGNTTTWTYDRLERLTSETNALSHTRTFVHNKANNVEKATDRNGRVIEYNYDGLNRLTSEVWKTGSTVNRTLWFSYDAASQLLTAIDPSISLTFSYDALGRTTRTVHNLAALTTNIRVDEVYDEVGNRTELKSNFDGYWDFRNVYAYDDLGRMTSLQQRRGSTGSQASDVNLKRVDFTYDVASQLSTITRYADLTNRLVKVTFKDANDDVVKVVENQYDTFNRWIGKTLDPDGETGSAAVTQTSFIHDGNQIILEFDDPTRFDLITRYLWGPSVDQLLAVEEVDDILTAGEPHLYDTDRVVVDWLVYGRSLILKLGLHHGRWAADAAG